MIDRSWLKIKRPKLAKLEKIKPIKSLVLTPEREETMSFFDSMLKTIIDVVPLHTIFKFGLFQAQAYAASTETKWDDNGVYGLHKSFYENGLVDFPPASPGGNTKININPAEFPSWLKFVYDFVGGERFFMFLIKIAKWLASLTETTIDDEIVDGIHFVLYAAGLVKELPENSAPIPEMPMELPQSVFKSGFSNEKIPMVNLGF
jgi:hypothetical protein